MVEKIKVVFRVISLVLVLFALYLTYFYITAPHYFYAIDHQEALNKENSYMGIQSNSYYDFDEKGNFKEIQVESKQIIDENGINVPQLECKNTSKFEVKEYNDVLSVRVVMKKCFMYNLPSGSPYIKHKNKIVWFIISKQWIFYLSFILLFVLKELYDRKQDKETLIRKVCRKIYKECNQ